MTAGMLKRTTIYNSPEFYVMKSEGWATLGVERAKPHGPLMAVMMLFTGPIEETTTEPEPEENPAVACLQRQLDAVDKALGFPHPEGYGRVELIERLRATTIKPRYERDYDYS